MNKKSFFLLTVLTLIGAVLRFYKLDWGQGFFFHPDERNIASAVLSLNPAEGDFNPNFFAYGSFPIYITYAIGTILSFLTKTNWLEFGRIILIGRVISATLSTLLIPLVYLVFQQSTINNQQSKGNNAKSSDFWGIVAATLTAFTPGLIQYAHFSTFEIILTFEYLLALYFALKISQRGRWQDYLYCAVIIGVSIATKMTSLLVVPILPLAHFLIRPIRPTRQIERVLIALILLVLTTFILSPYNVLDFSSFRGAMDYEGGVATGRLPVFYTAQFIKTTPFLYQLTQVFPYILGWPLTAAAAFAFLYLIFKLSTTFLFCKTSTGRLNEKLKMKNEKLILLLTIPMFYLGFHSLLFVKWTRYMIPMLPFLIIMSIKFLKSLRNYTSRFRVFLLFAFCCLLFAFVVQGLSFFSIYLHPDTRVAAALWASKNIPCDAKILSEVWDMGIITFNPHFEEITLFNFYELDSQIDTNDLRINPEVDASRHYGASVNVNPKIDELTRLLEKSEYIIVPSQRIYRTRSRLPERFPVGARYYQSLFDGSLGFAKIAEFDSGTKRPQGSFCLTSEVKKVWSNEVNAEETFKVFDRPKVIIFEKVSPMTQSQYSKLLLQ